MTKLTKQMQRYLMTIYQNSIWPVRVIWAWKVSRMSDKEIMDTYHAMTTRG